MKHVNDAIVFEDGETQQLVEALSEWCRTQEEDVLPMLIGDESDLEKIQSRYSAMVELRDDLCEHWRTCQSVDRYEGEYLCIDCGEEFDDYDDMLDRAVAEGWDE